MEWYHKRKQTKKQTPIGEQKRVSARLGHCLQ